MKLWQKITAAVVCSAMCLSVGCGENSTEEKLYAPSLALDGNAVYWSIVDGAEDYGVYVGGELSDTVSGLRYSLAGFAPGSYTVEVTARRGGEESGKSNAVTYVKEETETPAQKTAVAPLDNGKYEYSGLWQTITDTVVGRQLLDEELWAGFVNQFRSGSDAEDSGWRGEFWGKLMIGACLTYEQTKNESLYSVLESTVADMLTTQSEDGRISTYGRLSEGGNEFYGWDMWCRKYVIMGMESFYDICKDEALKKRLLESMLAQLDYIMLYVGDGEDKLNINETGVAFKGLASSSILEGIVKLYTLTGERKALDFATHIVANGGSGINNLVDAAIRNDSLPYTWGAPKAYELSSFFDGVLDYYLATGIAKYRTAGMNYAYAVMNSEITVTGGAGYNSEEFNYSVREQANPSNTKANLETCVTTSVMRLFYKAYMIGGDTAFIDSMEKTLYNAMIGSVDTEGNFDHAFTSYFNLVFSAKVRASAGGMHMEERDYGCCIAYGAAGTGLVHKIAETATERGFNVNFYLEGAVTADSPSQNPVTLVTQTNYPYSGSVKITVKTKAAEAFDINLRIPAWSDSASVSVNGVSFSGVKPGEYYTLSREWKDGDEIVLSFDMKATLYYGSAECSNPDAQYNVAVLWGPVALARDKRLDGGEIFETVDISADENGAVLLQPSATASFDTICEFAVTLKSGKVIHMVDYASAGKTYDENSLLSVFLPVTDYWKKDADLEGGTAIVCVADDTLLTKRGDGLFGPGNFYYDYTDLSSHRICFVDRGGGWYSLYFASSGKDTALTVRDGDSKIVESEYTGADAQLFRLERLSLFTYKLVSKDGRLLSADGGGEYIHMYPEAASDKQKWKFVSVN